MFDDDRDDRERREPVRDREREGYRTDDSRNESRPPVKKKKRSLLEDLFDFG